MILWVLENASKVANLDRVVVATDHDGIAQVVRDAGGEAIVTMSEHPSGTDRCLEALNKLGEDFDTVVNIQGDEPFIQPAMIESLLELMAKDYCSIGTLVKPIDKLDDLLDPNKVKVVVGRDNQALYFSRSPIPFFKDQTATKWLDNHTYYKHIGLYGYRPEVLHRITHLEPSSLERAESLEQLRWLENGFTVHAAITKLESPSIDTPEDLARAELLYP
jgi:3-deoxy-manno-octulosonate cytidylyltransferase (CMP-KDO synthetase)